MIIICTLRRCFTEPLFRRRTCFYEQENHQHFLRSGLFYETQKVHYLNTGSVKYLSFSTVIHHQSLIRAHTITVVWLHPMSSYDTNNNIEIAKQIQKTIQHLFLRRKNAQILMLARSLQSQSSPLTYITSPALIFFHSHPKKNDGLILIHTFSFTLTLTLPYGWYVNVNING